MNEIKVTKSLEKFLFDNVLPNYIIYSRKEKYAFCTYCQKRIEMPLNEAKARKSTICPVCKKEAVFKAKGQIKGAFGDFGGAFALGKDDRVCVRTFDVSKSYDKNGILKNYYYKEVLREYFDKNGFAEAWDNAWEKGWKKCNIRQHDNYRGIKGQPIYHINLNYNIRATYTGNIKSVIKGTPWEYSCMAEIFKMKNTHNYVDVFRHFLKDYAKCPAYEYMYKVGFKKLLHYGVFYRTLPLNLEAKTLPEILKVSKPVYKMMLKKGNPTYEDLLDYQDMTRFNITSEYDLSIWKKYFGRKDNSYYSYNRTDPAQDFRKYFTKTWYQFDKYASQTNNFNTETYRDYLKMCSELGYDMKNTFVVFPKYLNDAHQRVADEWNLKNNPKERERARKRNSEYVELRDKYSKEYAFAQDNLQIVVPNDCEAICIEGQTLHHCVGTYIDKVCKGLSVILFIRDVQELCASYYTMEIANNNIVQVRGFRNGKTTPEVKNFVTNFATMKHLTMNNIA